MGNDFFLFPPFPASPFSYTIDIDGSWYSPVRTVHAISINYVIPIAVFRKRTTEFLSLCFIGYIHVGTDFHWVRVLC